MTTPDASLGHEEEIAQESEHPDYIIESEPSVQTQAGVFEGLRSWGRGAFGKVMLATALIAPDATPSADAAPPRGARQSASAVDASAARQRRMEVLRKLSQIAQSAYPLTEVDDEGFAAQIALDGQEFTVTRTASRHAKRPGVYYNVASDQYFYVAKDGNSVPFKLKSTEVGQRPVPSLQQNDEPSLVTVSRSEPVSSQPPAPNTPAESIEHSPTYVSPSPAMRAAEEAMKKLEIPVGTKLLTINHGYDANNKKESRLRGPSIVEPNGYKLLAALIEKSVEVKYGRETVILLPCPRDIEDQFNLGSLVSVTDRKGRAIDVQSRIIYTAVDKDGQGFVNSFIEIRVNSKDRTGKSAKVGGVIICKALNWIVMGQYPDSPREELAKKLNTQEVPVANAALAAGLSIRWAPTPQSDCGAKARAAEAAGAEAAGEDSKNILGYIGGFSLKPHALRTFGGRHARNIFLSEAGIAHLDADDVKWSFGPNDGFITTVAGSAQALPDIREQPIEGSLNGGYDIGEKDSNLASMRILQNNVPPVVQAYARTFWNDRMRRAYGNPDVALSD